MNFTEGCARIQRMLETLDGILTAYPDSSQRAGVTELRADLASNFYAVVVLGEFKRGKSTLLNAVLGRDLLPTDVTPTTAAINVLRYADEP